MRVQGQSSQSNHVCQMDVLKCQNQLEVANTGLESSRNGLCTASVQWSCYVKLVMLVLTWFLVPGLRTGCTAQHIFLSLYVIPFTKQLNTMFSLLQCKHNVPLNLMLTQCSPYPNVNAMFPSSQCEHKFSLTPMWTQCSPHPNVNAMFPSTQCEPNVPLNPIVNTMFHLP